MWSAGTATASRPLIIAHRGASGHRPEHTLAAYELAIVQGADFLEVDLVPTRDGVLVARHENALLNTTDVAARPEWRQHKTTKQIEGLQQTGWFTEDFSLEELKQLRAIERMPNLRQQNQAYDRRQAIPTLQEIIDLVRQQEQSTGRTIGLYLETKRTTYFRSIGLPLEGRLVEVLDRNGYRAGADPVFLESFEAASLRELNRLTPLRLVQLIGSRDQHPDDFVVRGDPRRAQDLLTQAGLAEIAGYAAAIGVPKEWFQPHGEPGLPPAEQLVRDAHQAGLLVHVWTFRNENYFLPEDLRRGDPEDPEFLRRWGEAVTEYKRYFGLGVDGVFSDFPATARQAVMEFQQTTPHK